MRNSLPSIIATALLISCANPQSNPSQKNKASSIAPLTEAIRIVALGRVEPENGITRLSSPSAGVIKNVLKQDGDSITKGELLIELYDELEQSRINEIKTQMNSQRSQIEIEKTNLKEINITLASRYLLQASTRRMVGSGAEKQQTSDDLGTEVSILEIDRERISAKIEFASKKLNELNAQLRTANITAKKKQFVSPCDGLLLDMQVGKGEAVDQFATYAEFAPKGDLIVRAEVDELFSGQVKSSQKVEVVNTSSGKLITVGKVIDVSPYFKKKSIFSEKPNDQEDRRVRTIRISVNEKSDLIINSKVECIIKP